MVTSWPSMPTGRSQPWTWKQNWTTLPETNIAPESQLLEGLLSGAMLVSGRVTNNISQGMSKDFDSVCMSSWPRLQMWSCPSPSSLQDFIEKIQAEPKGRARDSYVSGCLRIADVLRRPMFLAFPLGKQHHWRQGYLAMWHNLWSSIWDVLHGFS